MVKVETLCGFIADAEMPYFACFRKPASTSVMMTYPVPPFTTVLGLFANALGVPRPAYTEAMEWLQNTFRLNLRPLAQLERPFRELAKILKLVGEKRETRQPTSFPSSPMHKYMLPRPAYRIFVASDNANAVAEVAEALRDPKRPLYLGQSDDVVTVTITWQGAVVSCHSNQAWAMVPGIREASHGQRMELLRLPLAFEGERRLIYSPVLTLPSHFPFALPKPEPMWRFNDETVHLISVGDTHAVAGEECET